MKICINDVDILELSEIQKKVIKNDIDDDLFFSDMIRRMKWSIEHIVENICENRNEFWRKEFEIKGLKDIPTDPLIRFDVLYSNERLVEDSSDLIVSVDNTEVFRISPSQRQLLRFYENAKSMDYYKEKIKWILIHKYERCLERLRKNWESNFSQLGIESIPVDNQQFCQMVFSHPTYKSKKERELNIRNN